MPTQLPPIVQETDSAYLAYSYSYPHKSAYRKLDPSIQLSEAWANDTTTALSLYAHIPFCEMRCGFCNLFTTSNPDEDFVDVYLRNMRRQAIQVKRSVPEATFARLAIGGGTPTFLSVAELDYLFSTLQEIFGADSSLIPTSVEVSPLTATPDKIKLLAERGVSRVSMGVQSFDENEVRSVGRSQRTTDVVVSLERLRESAIPTVNVDLIYGIPGQTHQSWLHSLETAVSFEPEEIYLYPLYIRPLTGLGKSKNGGESSVFGGNLQQGDERLSLYRVGRDYLRSRGYNQVSMRMFQAAHAPALEGPVYCCQTDGMIGIGCGARSYTSSLHYSHDFAVSAKPIMSILHQYVESTDEQFSQANHGIRLSDEEQKRRFILQSLLQIEGLDLLAYMQTWPGYANPIEQFGVLGQLLAQDFACHDPSTGRFKLTELGLELSDQIGVWLYSEPVVALMRESEVV